MTPEKRDAILGFIAEALAMLTLFAIGVALMVIADMLMRSLNA